MVIRTLAKCGVTAERREGRIGVWVERAGEGDTVREDKVAAIGVRVRQWVTYHGIAINIDADLSHYAGIVPCGITEHGVTSLHDLGKPTKMGEIDKLLKQIFDEIFGLEPRRMTLKPEDSQTNTLQKLPAEAMPTETGTQDTSNPIEETHPVFRA